MIWFRTGCLTHSISECEEKNTGRCLWLPPGLLPLNRYLLLGRTFWISTLPTSRVRCNTNIQKMPCLYPQRRSRRHRCQRDLNSLAKFLLCSYLTACSHSLSINHISPCRYVCPCVIRPGIKRTQVFLFPPILTSLSSLLCVMKIYHRNLYSLFSS